MAIVAILEALVIVVLVVAWVRAQAAQRRREDELLTRIQAPDLVRAQVSSAVDMPRTRGPQRERSMSQISEEVDRVDGELAERGFVAS